MALDKFYGSSDKLKEFVDFMSSEWYSGNSDIALNHAFGRNPMVRMWMNDPDGDGWKSTTENPYLIPHREHSYM
jgi:hypothetical protein